ncbi:MAG: hypothetical protein AMXMBFR20_17850 [Planctomycetia bacterium]|jgi:hypothetical protein
MTPNLSRREAVRQLAAAGIILGTGKAAWAEDDASPKPAYPPAKKKVEKGPRLDLDLVREFVGAAHGDLEKTKKLLAEKPSLINATHDWSGGDWETALGGASHMGRRDIAEFLLANNARLDIFAATMLGKLEVVKAVFEAFPDTLSVPGPHGIPLIRHAEAGRSEAAPVLEFLRSIESARKS